MVAHTHNTSTWEEGEDLKLVVILELHTETLSHKKFAKLNL
jgi:hypothetical protein